MKTATTKQIAEKVGKSERHVRQSLDKLQRIGLVERIGQRGGGMLTDKGTALVHPRAADGENDV